MSQLNIGKTAQILGVSIQTVRRWDSSGYLKSSREEKGGHRFYNQEALELGIQEGKFDFKKMAKSWALTGGDWVPLDSAYCPTSAVFHTRLQLLGQQLASVENLKSVFQFITATAGEIGNNSFDHNLGNWPDMPGIFFGCDLRKRYVILADRGQGILTTLKRVRPELAYHDEALRVAFTEIVTGRSREHRGNGLKFVRKIVTQNNFLFEFQTGDAHLELKKGDTDLSITGAEHSFGGCFALLSF